MHLSYLQRKFELRRSNYKSSIIIKQSKHLNKNKTILTYGGGGRGGRMNEMNKLENIFPQFKNKI